MNPSRNLELVVRTHIGPCMTAQHADDANGGVDGVRGEGDKVEQQLVSFLFVEAPSEFAAAERPLLGEWV